MSTDVTEMISVCVCVSLCVCVRVCVHELRRTEREDCE